MAFQDTRPAPIDPDDRGDAMTQFRSEHPSQVLALLRELRDVAAPVVLSAPGGANLGATLWTIDSERARLTFDVEGGDPHLPTVVEADEMTAVAYLDAVKVQFDLQDLVLVRGARAAALQARMPRCVYRFQRRGGFRVRPLARSAPQALLRHPSLPDMPLALRVLDISIGGCALLLPANVPPLALGSTLAGVWIELDSDNRLPVTLRLQHATSLLSNTPGLRLGCELLQLDADSTRRLQRYIDQTQKRRRLLALD